MHQSNTFYQSSDTTNMVGHENTSVYEPGSFRNNIELPRQNTSIDSEANNATLRPSDEQHRANNVQIINNKKLHYVIHSCSSTSSTYAAE